MATVREGMINADKPQPLDMVQLWRPSARHPNRRETLALRRFQYEAEKDALAKDGWQEVK